MKTSIHPALAAVAALSLAFSPVLLAQETSTPDQSQNARANDSTADQHANDNGSSASQPGTLEKNNSKDASTETRDANPGTASTDSANQAGTKSPSDATTSTSEAAATSGSNSGKSEKPLTDKEFVMRAAQGGMTEVEMGKIASDKGNSSEVKDFGARMVKDHSQANDELKGIADKKGIALSSSLDSRHQGQVDRLSKLSGPAFDKAYVSGQVRAHESTVALFKEEAQSGQDADLKAFASRTLPTLQDHCSSIMDIQKNGVK